MSAPAELTEKERAMTLEIAKLAIAGVTNGDDGFVLPEHGPDQLLAFVWLAQEVVRMSEEVDRLRREASRVRCAQCQEEGRDGCFLCGVARPPTALPEGLIPAVLRGAIPNPDRAARVQLVELLLGVALGARVDLGQSDDDIMAACIGTLAKIRAAVQNNDAMRALNEFANEVANPRCRTCSNPADQCACPPAITPPPGGW
jgi:hypothetical protein